MIRTRLAVNTHALGDQYADIGRDSDSVRALSAEVRRDTAFLDVIRQLMEWDDDVAMDVGNLIPD